MATCVVSGLIKDPSETAISGVTVRANLTAPVFVATVQLVPKELSTTTASDGTWSLTLSRSLSYVLTVDYPPNATNSAIRKTYAITTPAAATADFSTLATEL